jgi:hypothetical protein
MVLDSEFVEACDSGNKRLVRIKLANIITIDPTLETFREMKPYAEQRVTGLYDTHSGEPRKDRLLWTKDYYNEQQTELSFNFSSERLDLLCDIAQHIYGGAGGRINAINEKREQERRANASTSMRKGAATGGAIGAVVGVGVAAFAGKAIIGGGIIGGVIGVVVGAVIAANALSNGKPD